MPSQTPGAEQRAVGAVQPDAGAPHADMRDSAGAKRGKILVIKACFAAPGTGASLL